MLSRDIANTMLYTPGHLHGLTRLVKIVPVQDSLFEYLLPFDIAKLRVVTGLHLTDRQEKQYLNPVRDVFIDHEDLKLLTSAGASVILLGHETNLLRQRLNWTEKYIATHGHDHIIDLVAIAYTHPDPPLNMSRFPSVRFAVTDQVLDRLGSRADIAYTWLASDLITIPCTNTSLAPMSTPPTSYVRLQQFRLNLRCCLFNTIDFVYPEEAMGIFDWTFDEDVVESCAFIIQNRLSLDEKRSQGRWLRPVAGVEKYERGTPALTRHVPSVNMHEIMFRLEIPREKKVAIIRVPTPLWQP